MQHLADRLCAWRVHRHRSAHARQKDPGDQKRQDRPTKRAGQPMLRIVPLEIPEQRVRERTIDNHLCQKWHGQFIRLRDRAQRITNRLQWRLSGN